METRNSKKILSFLPKINYGELGILYALIILWVAIFITNENFRKIENYLSILREASFVGVAAIGMTLCIISGAFDLSVGRMLTLLSVITITIVGKCGLVATVIIILILGGIFGIINGLLVAKVRLPAFIATLAMFYVYQAFAYIYTNGQPIQFKEKWFTNIGNGNFLGIPVPFIIFIVLAIIGTIILKRTPLGRYILAIGNSEKASHISGINIAKVKIIIFSLVGVFTAAAAILISSRLWSANAGMKQNYEFDVIAAVVLGGTSLAGGKGSIFNTVISSIFFASLITAMNIFQVESFMQMAVKGVVLLFAFSLTGIRQIIADKLRTRKKVKNKSNIKESTI